MGRAPGPHRRGSVCPLLHRFQTNGPYLAFVPPRPASGLLPCPLPGRRQCVGIPGGKPYPVLLRDLPMKWTVGISPSPQVGTHKFLSGNPPRPRCALLPRPLPGARAVMAISRGNPCPGSGADAGFLEGWGESQNPVFPGLSWYTGPWGYRQEGVGMPAPVPRQSLGLRGPKRWFSRIRVLNISWGIPGPRGSRDTAPCRVARVPVCRPGGWPCTSTARFIPVIRVVRA
ncbi:MAG: hypothetical protein BWY88_01051 [Synergistetes bacterium ADurb.Bin520]|nr:MAG: hypothetical protein BWY88_01051 [Synergistetes bacterium ADurb.Bin520]